MGEVFLYDLRGIKYDSFVLLLPHRALFHTESDLFERRKERALGERVVH